MGRYIISLLIFVIFLVVTLLNIGDTTSYVSLKLILFSTPPLPGIIILYLGMVIGALITIPIAVIYSKNSDSKVLNLHMKNETRRMKKMKNQEKEQNISPSKKGNINATTSTETTTSDNELD